jgi:hypothetical protein
MAGSTFQEKINTQGQDYIAGLENTVRQLWIKCCQDDKIPINSKFVVFKRENKFVPFYDTAVRQLLAARAQYRAGGYVGLQIGRR